MNLTHSHTFLLPLLVAAATVTMVSASSAAPRHRPANPRGVADPRGAADPRGVADPRGIADPRGAFDPRGPFDPRNPARYMYGLPSGYARRVYGGVTFYYCSTTYYYAYIINGQTVYVRCTVTNGVPVIPPRPY
jgi:hypothetical protein